MNFLKGQVLKVLKQWNTEKSMIILRMKSSVQQLSSWSQHRKYETQTTNSMKANQNVVLEDQ